MLHLGSVFHWGNYFRIPVYEVFCCFLVSHFKAPATNLPLCKSLLLL